MRPPAAAKPEESRPQRKVSAQRCQRRDVVALQPDELSPDHLAFMVERHHASLTLVGADGTPHVTPVGFTWDASTATARVITWSGAKKVRLLEEHQSMAAALCQIDGGRWLTLHGTATVSAEPAVNADAERRYADRYRPPGDRGAERRTIEVAVTRVLGRV